MKEKKTGDLCQELMEQPNLDSYLSGNETYFQNENPAAFLAALYDKIKISKAELARRAGMSEVYLHQVFAGRRNPSRDRLLCLCVGMELTLEETQELLKMTGYGLLYAKHRRDAIIAHGLVHHTPLDTINDALYTANEKTLF
ncbi:MAG: helix-turn-helix domain-containing protein [Oscillospiraceae bacterium]|nr:helix-turn-helix domain-containing protein [Oscillospiraceae bacterium]